MTITTLTHRLVSLVPACVVALALSFVGAAPVRAQSVAVMVNGEPITNFDMEQRSKLIFLTSHKQPSRQDVINELIDEKVKIKEAKKFGVDPSSSDIDQSFSGMAQRMRISSDQLAKSLEAQGIRPETLKSRIRAEMVWTALVRGRYKESLQIGEKDVVTAVEQAGEKTETDAFEYKMQPIVLVVPRGATPALMDARRKEADTYRERIQSCEEANSFFKAMPNTAIRDIVTKTSADLPAPLREMLDKTPIGHLTAPEVTKQGIEMVALCSKKATTVDTPKKREIRDKMFAQKFEAKSKAYLAEVRKGAMIEYPR